jgi:peptidoglycan/xylan/chitin deacetylase (PgdA/CDA1 family)
MTPRGLPVFTYHAFDTTGGVLATDPARFAETLDALAKAGFRGVNLDDWVEHGCPEVERGFALTFDDGFRSILEVADVVARYRVPATIFLVTDRMGGDNAWPGQPPHIAHAPLLGWSDLDDLEPLGFRVGAHGRTHARLDRCASAALEDEMRGSRDAIEDRTGRPCRLFAYPYGISNPRVRSAAERHFAGAFDTRLDLATSAHGHHRLARIDAYYLRSRRALDRLMTGRWRGWLRWRRALRAARRSATAFTTRPSPHESKGSTVTPGTHLTR